MKQVTVYTDGACSGNPGPGGWASILEYGEVSRELSGGEANTTNNRMELTAVIAALRALNQSCEVDLYSDSKYVIDALEKGWVYQWKRNGWREEGQETGPEPGPLGTAAGTAGPAYGAAALGKGPCGQPQK